jgi:glycerol uptake facilitator-like aquaporin
VLRPDLLRMTPSDLTRRVAAEFLGTAFLLIAIVGSGIMAERLAGGNLALALLANSLATGAALVAIILALGEISGAQLNPVVTLAVLWERGLTWREAAGYIAGQMTGAVAGVLIAHGMFDEPLMAAGTHIRTAVTVARSLTDTFAAIRPVDVVPFLVAQFAGAAAAVTVFGWLVPSMSRRAGDVVQPHGSEP